MIFPAAVPGRRTSREEARGGQFLDEYALLVPNIIENSALSLDFKSIGALFLEELFSGYDRTSFKGLPFTSWASTSALPLSEQWFELVFVTLNVISAWPMAVSLEMGVIDT
jgi:hypothetical protein